MITLTTKSRAIESLYSISIFRNISWWKAIKTEEKRFELDFVRVFFFVWGGNRRNSGIAVTLRLHVKRERKEQKKIFCWKKIKGECQLVKSKDKLPPVYDLSVPFLFSTNPQPLRLRLSLTNSCVCRDHLQIKHVYKRHFSSFSRFQSPAAV